MSTCQDYKGKDRRNSCHHADQAAERAVKKTFAILGVDVDSPKDVEEFRKDLRFSGTLRKDVKYGRLAAIGIIITGLGYAFVEGIKTFFVPK